MAQLSHPKWMSSVLKAAALYNLAFAAMTLVAPFWIFDVTGATRPNLPELWQCIGMIVGVYGIGYWIAASNPYRHWPVVLVGWLGKTFGPIGFAKALWEGVFPMKFGWIIVFNDLIWWIPFAIMVREALKRATQPEFGEITEAHHKTFTEFSKHSFEQPILVVFLRHSGCTFCREMIADLEKSNNDLKEARVQVVLVHMGLSGKTLPGEWKTFLDSDRALYRLAQMERGAWSQVVSAKVVWRAFIAGILKGHGVGALEGDGFMMAGARLWKQGQLIFSWQSQSVADRLPLTELLKTLKRQ